MLALVLTPRGLELVDDHPAPQPGPGEVLLAVRLAGICGTDLAMVQGYAGFSGVLGHELVGEVIASPDPSWLGQRVVTEINLGCGACMWCRRSPTRDDDIPDLHGAPPAAHCTNRRVIGIRGCNGGFAELIAAPLANLYRVPSQLSDQQALFIEPLAAALRVLEHAPKSPTDVAVVGPGTLGLLVAQCLRLAGHRVTVVGRQTRSLGLPRQLGFAVDLAGSLPPACARLAVDCSGSEAGLTEALRLTAAAGKLLVKSSLSTPPKLDLARLVVDEISLIGSRCGAFPPAIAALVNGRIEVDGLVEQTLPLAAALSAFDLAQQPGARKVLLRPPAK